MEEADYPGVRVSMETKFDGVITPLKIDISTGDVITPKEIKYNFNFMLEDRTIQLWAYNLETVLAEKLETVVRRNVTNTRMRDFYDIYTLSLQYGDSINSQTLKNAFEATCHKRDSVKLIESGNVIIDNISKDPDLNKLWQAYQNKYSYAADLPYSKVVDAVRELYRRIDK